MSLGAIYSINGYEDRLAGIAEVRNVDQPDHGADNTDGDGETLTKLVQTFLQGEAALLLGGETVTDLALLSAQASASHDTTGLASGDSSAREHHVALVLDEGVRSVKGLGDLFDGNRFTGQQSLLSIDSASVQGNNTNVSGDLVTNCDFDDIT